MKAMTRMALLLCASVPLSAMAAGQKSKTKAPDISIPSFGEIPKGEGMVAPKSTDLGMQTRTGEASATYKVVSVKQSKDEIELTGMPPATERFTTVVRVNCPQKANASIELVILDPRGDTVMTSSGELNFRGKKVDEIDYPVEWSSTPWPKGGTFTLLVRIGGQAMGTWPLKVVGPKG